MLSFSHTILLKGAGTSVSMDNALVSIINEEHFGSNRVSSGDFGEIFFIITRIWEQRR